MRDTRTIAFVAIMLAFLASSCSSNAAPQSEPTSSPSASTAPPTPAETPQPTEEPTDTSDPLTSEDPPELHLIGDDYEQIVRSHMAFRTWLFRNPDPELFDEITHPDCECYIQKDLLASYAEQGLRWTGGPQGIAVLEVSVIDDIADNHVHLQAVFERADAGELVDAAGNVHERVEPRAPWVEDLIFVREDEASPWLLRDFLDRGPLEEASDG